MDRIPSPEGVQQVRLLLADHHRCVAEGLAALLVSSRHTIKVVHTGRDLVAAGLEGAFDVAVAEIDMPDLPGLIPLRMLVEQRATMRFIVLSGHDEPLIVQEAMQAGAWGYVLKQSPSNELFDAIAEVVQGRRYVSASLTATLIGAPTLLKKLTRRQREVLERMAMGRRSSDIAAELGISTRTVESHRQTLLDTLGVHSGVALIREAQRIGLIRGNGPRSPRKRKFP